MRTAVFGLGPMGKRHITAATELGFEITGLCDRSPEALEKTRKETGLSENIFYADAEKMLSSAEPELVIVSTNSDSHEALTLLSARSGARFILCEKPMADSVAACANMIAECRSRGVGLAVNHPQRFMNKFRMLASIAGSEEMGGAESMTFVSANAGLAMMGSHFLEMSRIILGEEVTSVSANLERSRCRNPRGERFDDPCGTLAGKTLSGRKVTIVLGNDAGHGMRMIISCRWGMIDMDLIGGSFIMSSRKEPDRALPPTRYGCPAESSNGTLEGESVIESAGKMISSLVRGEREIESSASDAMNIVRVLAAACHSSENGGRSFEVADPGLSPERGFPWP